MKFQTCRVIQGLKKQKHLLFSKTDMSEHKDKQHRPDVIETTKFFLHVQKHNEVGNSDTLGEPLN